MDRWRQAGGYGEVLKIALPMILSMGSWSLMHFVDRMFLTWYSREALAASLPAGLLNFAAGSFFVGTAGYVNTFVAQYSGAGRPDRVGASVWQGLYFSLIAGVAFLGFIPAAGWIFDLAGHEPGVRELEVVCFRILCWMGLPGFVGVVGSCFFSGRGDTRTVMWVNFSAVGLNVVLDYAWIFGMWGFPEWGIRGAAWATVVAHVLSAGLFVGLMLRPGFRAEYHTLKGWRPDAALFGRLIRFGVPSGVQMQVDILAFSLFVLLVGRLGEVELAASNLTFNINTLAFLPMLGQGIAVSTLVGQYVGRDRADLAERSVWSAYHLALGYMAVLSVLFVLLPEVFLRPFSAYSDPQTFAPVKDMSVVLLRFVAVYSLFDAMFITFSAAIKGAGDTRFVMLASLFISWTLMVVPAYLSCVVYGWGLYVAWVFISLYIVVMGLVFLARFKGGKWKSMRVIEFPAVVHATVVPPGDTPAV